MMINIRQLASKESVGVNLKTTYAPDCVESSGLQAASIFVISPSQYGFESDCPEAKL